MGTTGYAAGTRKVIEDFLRKQRHAVKTEIERLGGNKRVINWHSLTLVMNDLHRDGLVKRTKVAKRIVVYEWISKKS